MVFDIVMNPAKHIAFFFFFPLCSSDGENGTDERRKPGKSPTLLLQTPTGEVEHIDDRKKVDVAR